MATQVIPFCTQLFKICRFPFLLLLKVPCVAFHITFFQLIFSVEDWFVHVLIRGLFWKQHFAGILYSYTMPTVSVANTYFILGIKSLLVYVVFWVLDFLVGIQIMETIRGIWGVGALNQCVPFLLPLRKHCVLFFSPFLSFLEDLCSDLKLILVAVWRRVV